MPSIIVIGAGAAGIAAARTLTAAGFTVTLLEARDRLGGRIYTRTDLAPHPVELGAEFIHGSQIITWQLLQQFGLSALSEGRDSNILVWLAGRTYSLPAFWNEVDNSTLFDDLTDWTDAWLADSLPDAAVEQLFIEWDDDLDEPLTPALRTYLDNRLSEEYGAGLSQLGIAGLSEATYEGDAEEDGNWRLVNGYTDLFTRLAEGLDLRLNTPVQSVTYSDSGVTITTPNQTFTAAACVITLPLAVLQANAVTFTPPLPADKQTAIQAIGSANVSKVILTFQQPVWPRTMSGLYTTLQIQGWWRPGWGRDNEAAILTGAIGGLTNDALRTLPDADLIDLALSELETIFNKPIRADFVSGLVVHWPNDPYAQMGYSYLPPGATGQRAILAAPVANRLFFAGEATHTTRPATVHGAYESGQRAAAEIVTAFT